MTTSPQIKPAKQQRSRETLTKLLDAAISVISADGLDAATIPRIAQSAGVAPASVYRRFRDKESLIRAAFLDLLERSNAANSGAVEGKLAGRSLEWIGRALARTLVAQYQAQPVLMRSLIRFVENDDDEEFKKRAIALVMGNVELIVDGVLANVGAELRQHDARRAVTFVTLVMANVVETRAIESVSMWGEMLPLSDDAFVDELERLFVSYLRY